MRAGSLELDEIGGMLYSSHTATVDFNGQTGAASPVLLGNTQRQAHELREIGDRQRDVLAVLAADLMEASRLNWQSGQAVATTSRRAFSPRVAGYN